MAKKSGNKPKVKKVALSFKQSISLAVGLAVILLGVSGWLYWDRILMNPDRALQDMLGRSLQTTSVTKVVTQTGAKQAVRLNYESEPLVRGVTILSQNNQAGGSSVTTETLGTKQADYVRYTNIATNGQPTPGVEEVLNIWATQDNNIGLEARPVFLNEASLSLIPFGNLSDADKQKVDAANSRQVYSYEATKTKWVRGRPVIIYSMNIKPADLIEVLKTYSEVTGIGDENQLRSEDYINARNLTVEIAIDAFSRQLVNISYPDAGRNEEYNGYGVKNTVNLPEQTISVVELQSKIQNLARQQPQ